MIAYLTGNVLFEIENDIVIDVHGVGYRVACTEATRNALLAQERASLFIATIVREQSFDLYGFETKQELYFFKKLLEVSGIGPRSALATLSIASPDTLYHAIKKENIELLSSVPGIGKKTAERMCIELRDKLKDYDVTTEESVQEGDRDVIDALIALGYSVGQAHHALAQIPKEVEGTNERIKYALGVLE